MQNLFEAKYGDEVSAKDGGFVFQAIISHEIKWEIRDGEVAIDPKKINCTLHQVDVFPDLKFKAGSATSTYVILSEVNILKRKFELASEAIKKRINLEYGKELESLIASGESSAKKKELNDKYFKNTYFEPTLYTNKIVLREVSSSGINSGSPRITLKLSTGMVNTLDNQPINSWDSFLLTVDGSATLKISNQSEEPISTIQEYDSVENVNDLIFRTIVPSLVLELKGDSVTIDSFTQRSTRVASVTEIDYENLFNVKDQTIAKSPEETTA
jgi:hypothetical protein